jgi:hypothetical protein
LAFEGTKIRSTRNAATPIDGAREDLVAGETIACSLVGLVQTPVSYEWQCIGRPEGSVVGGSGANPWPLGNGASCAFVVDADGTASSGGAGNATIDGTYVVQCTVNKGSRLETRFSGDPVARHAHPAARPGGQPQRCASRACSSRSRTPSPRWA